ncbi:Exodeoxyribonuclease III [Archaeoglobus sulfaticallidus PM70-1]|uniref:Exodeoxyribonuclease III n=1 Tax=Archaeoglobus sulfaticallidus PM70-1 TaxID=387631 RepID=N0BGE1_9EURY|nr:exodeoxyribonuclease III [Archaeoglobus sulfaticallidus]AGK62053.1 Exodeoxyribonuclease III [Archaeoglobus sulfaticallidus PM70-1]
MLRVATFNVNSIRSRLHIVIPWIREHKPDILCLQETKVADKNFPESEFHRIGYHVVFSGSKGRNGVAIVSKKEPEEFDSGLDGNDRDRLLRAVIDGITVINIYAPQGQSLDSPMFRYKLDWYKRFKNYLENLNLSNHILICGDFNVAPEEIDVHNPKRLKNHVCFHEDVRKAFKEILSLGFVDIFRKHHPDDRQYTFFDYRVRNAVEKGLGWRVDHILATESLAERSVDCYIDMNSRLREKPSDHTVLVADFEV